MNSTFNDLVAPPLPLWFLLPATAVFAVATIYWMLGSRGRATRYLIFICWFRYSLGALHQFTYQEAVPGVRWVALGSLLSIVIGLVVLDKWRMFSRPFIPVAILIAVMVVSALLNDALAMAIEPMLRLLFFLLAAVALWQALETHGGAVFRRLLFVFLQPIVFLGASVVLDVPKSGELDGSISYIGGYLHEELFSLILVTALLVALLASKIDRWSRTFIVLIAAGGIYLTQYRTSILAIVPMVVATALIGVPRAFRLEQQHLVRICLTVFTGFAILMAAFAAGPRFSDLATISDSAFWMKAPEAFSWEDQRVLSARPYIWSQYLHAYAEAPTMQKIVGHGPDSWEGNFPLYAHNTMVSFLYELGLLGVASLLLLWFSMLRLALRATSPSRAVIVAGHCSFILLSMATMPQWQIEGNIFYGLLCGYTIAKARLASRTSSDVESWFQVTTSVTRPAGSVSSVRP